MSSYDDRTRLAVPVTCACGWKGYSTAPTVPVPYVCQGCLQAAAKAAR